ncbi:MAG TPA: hypothetical protein PLM22_10415 [Candidatus Sabulitectum sp.]|nr:hypothetical protein [Candidatus Sabulitectum sp.]HPJ29338.1 hypothetical protein [Candidatus Sabulitectum sp.]HPR22140.1 hypothetical protein [Candidatus Sabulitectum sp.]HRW77868.1 hypothetical protein [Candidatus Sabulitectum sp.]
MRTQLISYLEAGGSVYFEGNDIGYSNNSYDIWPYTGLTYAGDGSPASTGNVQSLTGSGMCSGMTFDYPYKSEADGYVDFFTPNGGAIVFQSQEGNGRVGCYSGPTNNYRTITSAVFFSVFQESGTTRQELMAEYMTFLTGGTGTAEESAAGFSPASVSITNPCMGDISLSISLPEPSLCRLDVYNIAGRMAGTVVNSTLPSGISLLSFPGTNLSPGTYFIVGEAGDLRVSRRTVLVR